MGRFSYLICFSLSISGVLSAQSTPTNTWQGMSGGSWNTAGNWSLGIVPNATDANATFNSGDTESLTSTSFTIGDLEFQSGNFTISGGSQTFSASAYNSGVATLNITGGTLKLSPSTFTLDSPLTINNYSSSPGILTIQAQLVGSEDLTIQSGSFDYISHTPVEYSGIFHVTTGTILNGSGNTGSVVFGGLEGSGTVNIDIGVGINLGFGNTDSTFSGTINYANRNNLTKIGTGTFTMAGTVTVGMGGGSIYQVGVGTFSIGGLDNLAPPAATWLLDGNVTFQVTGNTPFTLPATTFELESDTVADLNTIDITSTTMTVACQVTDQSPTNGILALTGGGTLVLSNSTNNYSGGTQINGGTLSIGASSNLGTGATTFTGNSTLLFNTAISPFTGSVFINSGVTGIIDVGSTNSSISSVIANGTGPGKFQKNGSGMLSLSGVNTYTGGTNISAGTLQTSADNVMPSTGLVTLSASTIFDLNSTSQTIGNLTGPATSSVTLGTNALKSLTLGDSTNQAFAGMISGSGELIKVGSGIFTLSNNTNSYSGGTQINAGTLSVSSSSNLGSNTMTFNGDTTLQFNAAISNFSAPIAINGAFIGSIDTDGNNSTISSVIADGTGSGILQKIGTGTLTLSGINTYSGGTLIDEGTLSISTADNLSGIIPSVKFTGDSALQFNAAISNFSVPIEINFGITGSIDTDGNDSTITGVIEDGNGPGTLAKVGTGTLTLSHTNTYSFGTTIAAGTLSISTQDNLSTNTPSVFFIDDSTLQFNAAISNFSAPIFIGEFITGTIDTDGNNSTISSVITDGGGGSGSLQKIGAGTLTLSGMNNYSADTRITAGTLSVSSVENLSINNPFVLFSGDSTLQFNAAIMSFSAPIAINSAITGTIDTDGNNSTISSVIADGTGAGTLQKIGAGMLTLSGTNTYSGGTLINAGTLSISTAGNLSTHTPSLKFTGDSALQFNAAISNFSAPIAINSAITGTIDTDGNNSTISSVIADGTGAGTLQKISAGTLTLSGTNTYSGGTQLNAGTLSVSSSSNLGSNTMTFTGDSTLQFNAAISNFSAPLAINSAITGTIDTDGNNSTINSAISGMGNLIKLGNGILDLTAHNTYLGTTAINGGRLSVNNTLDSASVAVNTNGTLGGTGTVNDVTLSGGTIAPGNSIGTMDVNGTFTATTGIVLIEINPTTSSSIDVIGLPGTATLTNGASVQVNEDAGTYTTPHTYTILTATGGVSGMFNPAVQSSLPGFQFTLDYSMPNTVLLVLTMAPLPPTPPAPTKIATAGLTGNAAKFARYLNKNAPNSAATKALAQLSGKTLKDALNSASPARNAFGTFITQNVMLGVSDLISSHLIDQRFFHRRNAQQPAVASYLAANDEIDHCQSSSCEPWINEPDPCAKYSFWLDGFGEYSHLKAQDQNPSFNAFSGAALLGFDYYSPNNLVGFGAGYAYTHLIENGDAGDEKINYYLASIYDTLFYRDSYLELGAWGAYDQIHNHRHISFPGVDATASATIHSWQLVPHLGFGCRFGFCWGQLEPFGQADCAINWQQSYQEHGAGAFDMNGKSQTSALLRTEAGFRVYESWETACGIWMVMEKISYVYQKAFHSGRVISAILGTPALFTVSSITGAQNMGSGGLEFLWRSGHTKPVTLSFAFNGEWGSQYMSYEGLLKLAKDF